jgi:hypothetical protein
VWGGHNQHSCMPRPAWQHHSCTVQAL